MEAVGQLAAGHGHAAGAEVVAALDEAGHFAVAEQPLQLAFFRGVALLHFRAAAFHGMHVVGLGGAGGPAAAVAAGLAAQQDDIVAGDGLFPPHVGRGSRADDRAHLHALGHVAGVIQLVHQSGGQTDLVAVGAVAVGGLSDQLALGQLAGDGVGQGGQRVRRAGEAHGLIDVGPAGQGVADGPAQTGGGAAEGLDLGGMVVGLVLEQQQPGLGSAVHVHLQLHRASVDLRRFVHVLQDALLLQIAGGHGGHVHHIYGLCAAGLLAGGQIAFPGRGRVGVQQLDAIDGGVEGGMAAVIGPVGVQHSQLGHAGVPLLTGEIVAAAAQVGQVHGQTVFADVGGQLGVVRFAESFKQGHVRGLRVDRGQSVELFQLGLTALHRVDEVLFDGLQLRCREVALQQIDAGVAHQGPFAAGDQLHALGRGIGPLIELAGQGFHRQHAVGCGQLVKDPVRLGLGEDGGHAFSEQSVVHAFHVIAVQQAQSRKMAHARQLSQLGQSGPGVARQLRLFFYVYSEYHRFYFLSRALRAARPMSRR